MRPEIENQPTYETDTSVFFYSSPFDTLNNWSAHAVDVWGIVFPTAEHAYHWKKFEETEPSLAAKIRDARSPRIAKDLSRTSERLACNWLEKRIAVMTEVVQCKFAQHEEVRTVLLSTGEKLIVENSPVDDFWGCGSDGKGQNHLGRIWMAIRTAYQKLPDDA